MSFCKVDGIQEGGIARWNEAVLAVGLLYNLLVIRVNQYGTVRWEANPDSAIRVGDRIVAVDQSVGKGLTACLKLFKVG